MSKYLLIAMLLFSFSASSAEPLSPSEQSLFEISKLSSHFAVRGALADTDVVQSVQRATSSEPNRTSYVLTTVGGKVFDIVVVFDYVANSVDGEFPMPIPNVEVLSVIQRR